MKTYIFGTSMFATMMNLYLVDQGVNAEGYLVQKDYINKDLRLDLPIFSYEDIRVSLSKEKCKCLVAIGYNEMNGIRKRIIDLLENDGVEIISFIHVSSCISRQSNLGKGCIVLENTTIQPRVNVGKGNIFWSNVNVCHDTIIGDYNFFAASSVVLGGVQIGNSNFLGCNCTLKNSIKIGNRNLIGASAYVSDDVLDDEVVVPRKSIKLNKKSYELKI